MKIKTNDPNLEQNSETVRARDKIVEDFMPYWSKEEDCFKAAIITGPDTKKPTGQTFTRPIPSTQTAYENWLNSVVNPSTGQYYMQRNEEGIPIKGTGAKYVIKVITRIKVDKNEFLVSKGRLEGFSASGEPENRWVKNPESWVKTNFIWKRIINDRTQSYQQVCQGVRSVETVYELPFSAEAVDKLMLQADPENVELNIKDAKTEEVREVKWSSPKESLKLFKEKSFEYLSQADYIPAPVKAELRAKAEQQGLINKSYSPTITGPSTRTEYLA